jgi:proliferating cell nuclear antigen
MEIVIQNPAKIDTFASIFQHIKNFSDHINICLNSDKFYVQSMDKSHVSIFEIHLPADWFDEYKCETSLSIGIHSSIFFKVLNTCEKSQTMRLYLDSDCEGNGDHLFIDFINSTELANDSFDKHFEIPLIDNDETMLEIPEIEYAAEFSVSSVHFSNMIGQLRLFGDTIHIECSEEKIQLYATANETGKMTVDIPIDDMNSFAIQEGDHLYLAYSANLMNNICLYSKISKTIDIFLSQDFPIKMVYGLDQDSAKLIFYLAPKVNDNE